MARGLVDGFVRRMFPRRPARLPHPTTPPLERVAADVRRLNRQLSQLPDGTSWVRATATRRAYDDVLAVACQQLEVSTALLELPDGPTRSLERIRVEYLLGERGLLL